MSVYGDEVNCVGPVPALPAGAPHPASPSTDFGKSGSTGTQLCSCVCVSVAAFVLLWHCGIVVREVVWPAKPKYLESGP